MGGRSSNFAQNQWATLCCAFYWWRRRKSRCAVTRNGATGIFMYWMWRKGWDYEQLNKFGSHAGQPGNRDGVKSNTEYLIGHPAPPYGEFEVVVMIAVVTEEMH